MSLSNICSDLCNAVKTGKSEPQAVERFLNSIDHKDDPKQIIDCLRKLGRSYLSISEGDSTETKAKALDALVASAGKVVRVHTESPRKRKYPKLETTVTTIPMSHLQHL
jgi:hypothetical protein